MIVRIASYNDCIESRATKLRILAGVSLLSAAESNFELARVLFARAKTYIGQHRNTGQARSLPRQYLESGLTPDDPAAGASQ